MQRLLYLLSGGMPYCVTGQHLRRIFQAGLADNLIKRSLTCTFWLVQKETRMMLRGRVFGSTAKMSALVKINGVNPYSFGITICNISGDMIFRGKLVPYAKKKKKIEVGEGVCNCGNTVFPKNTGGQVKLSLIPWNASSVWTCR